MGHNTRRELLQASGIATTIALAGCMGLRGNQTDADDQQKMRIYISEVMANPQGNDGANLNQETVLIEMNAETSRDLSGFELSYSTKHIFTLPDFVSEVSPNSSLRIHTGKGENSDERDSTGQYILFVGSTTPLLADDGMELALRDRTGDVVDRISYPALKPGEMYVQPE